MRQLEGGGRVHAEPPIHGANMLERALMPSRRNISSETEFVGFETRLQQAAAIQIASKPRKRIGMDDGRYPLEN
jgi:hypothetical protein